MNHEQIKQALLRVATDLAAIDAALTGNTFEDECLRDILTDIFAERYEDARQKCTGDFDPTPWEVSA